VNTPSAAFTLMEFAMEEDSRETIALWPTFRSYVPLRAHPGIEPDAELIKAETMSRRAAASR